MVVGILEVVLYLHDNDSLKGKRAVVRSIKRRVQDKFNVSIAECDDHDNWKRITLGVAQIGADRDHVDQRTSLARAFAIQPEILMLDEPFSSLDAPTRSRLLQDLHALLSQTTITTVFVTHDLDEALLLGDRVAVILGGVLRQFGRPQDVFTAPTDADVAAFVGVETVIAGVVIKSQDGQVLWIPMD